LAFLPFLSIAHSYGLKSGVPTDILDYDGGCVEFPVTEGLYFLRSADGIATFEKDGETYIITANEGDDVEYGDYEEKVDFKDTFAGNAIEWQNMTADLAIFDPDDILAGFSKFFNSDCDTANAETPYCADSLAMTLGTSTVDYSDPTAPNIKQLTSIGGRGITIYKVESTGLTLVWDSEDLFEVEGCAAFPWVRCHIYAHMDIHCMPNQADL